MASCNDTVLTGQEGLIQFKPLGTTNCLDDYCSWGGTDGAGDATPERVYVGCSADYDLGDCITIQSSSLPLNSHLNDGTKNVTDGSVYYVVNAGVGGAGDVNNCGESMEGVPFVHLSLTEDGTPVEWDVSDSGVELSAAALSGSLTVTTAGDGYNGGVAGTLTNVDLINTNPTRSGGGAHATVTIGASGAVTAVEVTSGGSGYKDGDTVYIAADNGAGTNAVLNVPVGGVGAVRGSSDEGTYTLSLCEFQTVCGVRSFSIDLSRDELDVTTLPCTTAEACGKELTSFRKTQAGFATATGTLEVYFTCDQTTVANKILTGSLQKTQGGASVRLYVCTQLNPQGEIDTDKSLYIEADIQLLGMSFSVNPDDPTTATINFGVTSVASAFGLT